MRWTISVVRETTIDKTSLVLDELGRPHLSYYLSATKDLEHAQLMEGDWVYSVPDDQGYTGRRSSLALDSLGKKINLKA